METLAISKFASLHNDKTIFFSHIRHTEEAFSKIRQLDHEVILITGNCDLCIDNFFAPPNVRYWFAQNAILNHDRIIPIPIGLTNPYPQEIPGQVTIECGGSHEHGKVLSEIVTDLFLKDKSIPEKFIYSNFTVGTNVYYRSFIRDICLNSSFMDYVDPNQVGFNTQSGEYGIENGVQKYIQEILNHEAVLCPIGNGIDTHRVWETLYCNRIPITINANCTKAPKINHFNVGESWYAPPQEDEYALYTKLYSHLPIVILDSYEQLYDEKYLREAIQFQKNKKCNFDLLDLEYWKFLIFGLEKTLAQ